MPELRLIFIPFLLSLASMAWSHGQSPADITVMHAWSRAVPVAGMNAAGYMTLMNSSVKAITLTAATTDIALKTSLHKTVSDGDMVSMKALPAGITIPAQGQVELKPGGLHLMLMKIKEPLKEGDKIPVTLIFDSGEQLATFLAVRAIGADNHMHH